MQDWTCDEISQYDMWFEIYSIEGYVLKGIQVVMFTVVLFFIAVQRCQGKKQIVGSMSICIAIFSLLDGIFAVIRINSVYTVVNYVAKYHPVHSLEGICFYAALWLFGIKYYETAYDVELILSTDTLRSSASIKAQDTASSSRNVGRKKLINFVRWSVLAIICVSVITESVSVYRKDKVYVTIKIISYCVLTLVVIGIIVVMFAALIKFIWIVS